MPWSIGGSFTLLQKNGIISPHEMERPIRPIMHNALLTQHIGQIVFDFKAIGHKKKTDTVLWVGQFVYHPLSA
jgi:hypothetical protein